MAKRIIFRCTLPNGDVETIMEQPNHTVEALKVGPHSVCSRGRQDRVTRSAATALRPVAKRAMQTLQFVAAAAVVVGEWERAKRVFFAPSMLLCHWMRASPPRALASLPCARG